MAIEAATSDTTVTQSAHSPSILVQINAATQLRLYLASSNRFSGRSNSHPFSMVSICSSCPPELTVEGVSKSNPDYIF